MTDLSFNVHRVVKIKYLPGFISDWHCHDFYHYIYVVCGTGLIKIEDTQYFSHEDDFYLVNPGVYHEIASYKDFDFKTIEIKFTLEGNFISHELNCMPNLINIQDPKIRINLQSIMKEAAAKALFYDSIINFKFADVILTLLREHKTNNISNTASDSILLDKSADVVHLNNVVEFIEKNLNKNIEIKDLARIANLSESYFCTIFKSKFGVSANKYINSLKFAKSKELMVYSDLNITQIADMLGFNSLHYFSRFFKKMQGISPQEYIDKMKNDIRVDICCSD